MKVIEELSRIELGTMIIRELMAECDIHHKTKHREINGHIDCCQCSEDKSQLANTRRLETDKARMRVALVNKMKSKGVSANMGCFSAWQYNEPKAAEQHAKIIQLQKYSKSVNSCSPNLVIFGRTGAGKTMLANAVAINHYLEEEKSLPDEFNSYNQQDFYDHTCEMITSFDIAVQAKLHWGNYQMSEHDYIKELVANKLLIIDDLGAGDGYIKDRERIAQIVTLRHKRAPTMITTNMDINGLREYLGDRAWDRLQQNLLVMSCDWESYRAKTADIRIVGAAE